MGRLSRVLRSLLGAGGGDGPPAPAAENHAAVDALMREGLSRHTAGDLDGAEAAYRQVLSRLSDHVDALHLLGTVLGQRGRLDESKTLLTRALEIEPRHAAALADLGNVHRAAGAPKQAADNYRRAVEIDPRLASARRNLGYLCFEQGDKANGLEHLQAAVAAEPDVLTDQFTIAEHLASEGRHAEAVPHYRKAVELKPDLAVAHNHLAFSLSECGVFDAAVAHYETAVSLDPEDYVARNDFGYLLQRLSRADAAEKHLRKAIELNPEYAGGYLNLGNLERERRRLSEAHRCYLKALEREPENAAAHSNLGNTLKDQGRVAEAIRCFRRAIALRPGFAAAHSNLLLSLQYTTEADIEALREAHSEWIRCHISDADGPPRGHANTPEPERQLRIGYVSPDFDTHPVGLFIEPVLDAHDDSNVHVICYDDRIRGDALTERLKLLADDWRPIAGRSDEQVARMVLNDGIDILVDLAGHTGGNRMRLFARKPAPVQATWLGYLHSTGLPQMDYLIADAVAVPPDTLQQFSEEVVRLPQCFLCYGQPGNRPEAAPPPARMNGYVTFGCYSNLAKIGDDVLRVWREIMERCRESRLVLKNSAFGDAETRDEYAQKLGSMGFDLRRVILEGHSAHAEYFETFARLDVALDPFPFSGGTISADALWMGVPVVTLAGDRMASRTSASMLTCLGLEALVARDRDAYVQTAVALAEDMHGLVRLRKEMRRRFAGTALGEPAMFTAQLEAAYRKMWRQWCRRRAG